MCKRQRYVPYLDRVPEEHVMDIADDDGVDPDSLLPYETRGITGKKWRSSEKWVHAIPWVVLFCIFVLWWFSFTVKVVRIDGRIAAIRETDIPLLLNNTRIGIAFLAAEAMSPFALAQNFTVTNVTEVQLVNTAPQNFAVNNATEAQLVSNRTQNLSVKNVTEAQLVNKPTQNLAANNVTEIQLVSKRTQNLTAHMVTKRQLVSTRTQNLTSHNVTEIQLVRKRTRNLTDNNVTEAQLVSKRTQNLTANNVTGVEAMSSASQNLRECH
ncbi:hypothetical protein RchiOBHm_Chr5g0061801 [Rosa chinensis]|uniref:Transmembrane protein n=1 Tax=Rosa chinensis TaxID=74649 RepID=A0A2P6QI18_ROSCH|nr:uncharacterized protein LOC112168174 [Rosa chinensis]PRQ33814.1 hypothetical protein RchiOBHm_Chr5g0061801 [Rosa chinensis]